MTVFTKCAKGHDLTVEDAYLFSANGHRSCKQCAIDAKNPRKKRQRFAMEPAGVFPAR